MKRKTIFNTLVLTLMVLGSLFVANLSPYVKVSADSIPVVLIENNKYRDAKGNYYEKAIAGVSADSKINPYTMPSSPETKLTRGDILYFKYEPIVWQVLDYDSTNNRALVVSNKILANMPYQSTYKGDWEDCYTTSNGAPSKTVGSDYTYSNIRYWLNGYTQSAPTGSDTDLLKTKYNISSRTLNYGSSFYDAAFSTDEQNKILATTGIGANDATTYVYGEFSQTNPTSADKIFLLSYADTTNASYYTSSYSSSSTRYKKTTDYAASQGAYTSDNTSYLYNGYWRLRCINASLQGYAAYIEHIGTVISGDVYRVDIGIAPAMYLDTTGLTFYTDATCATTTTAAAKTYVKFGSYPQTVADCTSYITVPPTGVSINTFGIIFSSTILIGLFVWMGVVATNAIKSRKRK